ncbi:MAG: hypothetical protein PHF86_06535 [Candidatus Nanoarchaeia archaeon]|jgi:cytochrome b subunit of formate dehydrogenase|nr:hypothetical protein [Candidatus Nanoarchaeia archaeon]
MAEYSRSMPVRQDQTVDSEDMSRLIGLTSSTINFSQDVVAFEIANNSETATIFLNISGGVATLTSGIPIYPKQYYAADKKIKQATGISLISTGSLTDVRIIGHFNLETEE